MTRAPLIRVLATAGAVVLAGVLAAALLLRQGDPACAAPDRHSGKATHYRLEGTGHCSFPRPPADGLFVALARSEYAGAALCGSHIDVTGPRGTVRVKVLDSCGPCEDGHLDLSTAAFARIADPDDGVAPITYRAVSGARPAGSLSIRIKEGASRYWFAALVDNHGDPLERVRVRAAGGGTWHTAVRAHYNYWVIDDGAGPGPYDVQVTDVRGRSVTARGVALAPGETQATGLRLGAAPPRAAARPSARTTAPARTAPTRSASASAPASRTPATPSAATPPSAPPSAPAPPVALAAADAAGRC